MAYNKAVFDSYNKKAAYTAAYQKNKQQNQMSLKDVVATIKSRSADDEGYLPRKKEKAKPLYIQMRKRPEIFFDDSRMWIGKEYIVSNFYPKRKLAVGDLVLVHKKTCSTETPTNTFVGIVWYGRQRIKTIGVFGQYEMREAPSYSLIVKTLEGRKLAEVTEDSFKKIWWTSSDSGFNYLHDNDEWVNDNTFTRLEPVQWWIGKYATVKSPQFKAMAAVLNIHESIYRDLP